MASLAVWEDGKPQIYLIQGAEKTYASFELTITNPGGHSSRPRADNAIYELGYELNNRPDWVSVPIEGILTMLHQRE